MLPGDFTTRRDRLHLRNVHSFGRRYDCDIGVYEAVIGILGLSDDFSYQRSGVQEHFIKESSNFVQVPFQHFVLLMLLSLTPASFI